MLIKHQNELVELRVTEQMPYGLQGAGDTQFVAEVCVCDGETVFSAKATAWVEASCLAVFARQLRALEEKPAGFSKDGLNEP